jgi:hypothetical protein
MVGLLNGDMAARCENFGAVPWFHVPDELISATTFLLRNHRCSPRCPLRAQHSGPSTLAEILAIKERRSEYLTGVVDAYLGE